MTDLRYSFRRNAFTRERTFRIGPEGLLWSDGRRDGCILYHDISEVCFWRRVARGDAVVKGRTLLYLQMRYRSGQNLTSRRSITHAFVGGKIAQSLFWRSGTR